MLKIVDNEFVHFKSQNFEILLFKINLSFFNVQRDLIFTYLGD